MNCKETISSKLNKYRETVRKIINTWPNKDKTDLSLKNHETLDIFWVNQDEEEKQIKFCTIKKPGEDFKFRIRVDGEIILEQNFQNQSDLYIYLERLTNKHLIIKI